MTNMMSFAESTDKMTTGDAFGLGGSVTVLGVTVVFLALVALIFITWLYPIITKAILSKSAERKANKNAVKETVAATPKKEVPAPIQTADDTQLIAVIAAAVAASLGTSSNGIVIRSIRRSASTVPAWGKTGRQEQVYNRF